MRSVLIVFLLCVLQSSAAEALRGIPEIRALSRETADLRLPVRLEAVVTLYNPANRDLMVSDGRQGLFVLKPRVDSPTGALRPGDRVVVEGSTVFGGFIAAVELATATLVSAGEPLAPRRLEAAELMSPPLTLSWVETEAVIVAARRAGEFMELSAQVHGYEWPVMLPYEERSRARAADLMQTPVTIRGIIGNNSNADGQMTSRLLYVQSIDDIAPVAGGLPAGPEAPLTPVNRLLRNDSRIYDRVRVRGAVTHVRDGSLYVAGEGGALMIRAANVETFARGDWIEAEGFAVVAPFRPFLRAARVAKLAGRPPPPARGADLAREEKLSLLQNELITVRATLLAVDASDRVHALQCRAGGVFFRALIDAPPETLELEPESELELTGICRLEPEQRELSDEFVASVSLLVRDEGDIAVVRHPPWLNERRLLWILGALAVVTGAAFVWILLLRWQVKRQTREIAAGIERKAVENERQRVARDLHDTVEQHLTGLAIQVGNIRSRIKNQEPALHALELAGKMLAHCRRETQLSIQDLRSIALERLGLAGALDELLGPMAREAGLAMSMAAEGAPFGVSGAAGNHLLRIAQAAVANAVRHARAREIRIRIVYTEDRLELSVADDGDGFDAGRPAPQGHFGLMGMRERANKLRGRIAIESAPGRGTVVRVSVERRHAAGKTA